MLERRKAAASVTDETSGIERGTGYCISKALQYASQMVASGGQKGARKARRARLCRPHRSLASQKRIAGSIFLVQTMQTLLLLAGTLHYTTLPYPPRVCPVDMGGVGDLPLSLSLSAGFCRRHTLVGSQQLGGAGVSLAPSSVTHLSSR